MSIPYFSDRPSRFTTSERWDRQDARACLRYGRALPIAWHVRVAQAFLDHPMGKEDKCMVSLAIDYLEGMR